jgi:polyphosphate glucokinase
MLALGIDIGGSGIKAAVVDCASGGFASERVRVVTPEKPGRERLLAAMLQLMKQLDWHGGPVGVGFPGVVRRGTIRTAVNLSNELLDWDMAAAVAGLSGGPVAVLNDADAAGVAEMRFGAGRKLQHEGKVLLITVGTGLGTVLFCDGMLVPNLELGHLEYRGASAELSVSERARKQQELGWKRWGGLLNGYLRHIEFLVQPDLIILGGGGVKKPERFIESIQLSSAWEFAHYGNRAGIIGAALAAAQVLSS